MLMIMKFTAAVLHEFDIPVVKQLEEVDTLFNELPGMEVLLSRRCAV